MAAFGLIKPKNLQELIPTGMIESASSLGPASVKRHHHATRALLETNVLKSLWKV